MTTLAAITYTLSGGAGSDVIHEGDDRGARGTYDADGLEDLVVDLVGLALEGDHLGTLRGYGPRVVAVGLATPGCPVELHDLVALCAVGRFLGWLSDLSGDWPYSTEQQSAEVAA